MRRLIVPLTKLTPKCPWCGEEHLGRLLLCPKCEPIAEHGRVRRGLPVRPVPPPIPEEPDD